MEHEMAIRLEQMHPVLVHLPIALLPVAVVADWLGATREDDAMREVGRSAIRIAAAGAVAAAGTGLIAGEEVNEGRARDLLVTHRNLNFAATVATLALASWRSRNDRPGAVYVAAGAAAVGLVSYTAYLGGRLVYANGVGVKPAGGVYRSAAPTLRAGQLRAFFTAALVDLVHGVRHMIREVSDGNLVPHLTGSRRFSLPE